jgi:uncharacterized membrane protein
MRKMSEKGKAIIAYVLGFVGGLIVLFALKDSTRNTKFHAAQSIVISVGYWIAHIAYSFMPFTIPFFGTILWIIYIFAMIIGISKAYKEEDPELQVVGGIAKSIFGKEIEK